jgi:drug/metabolite transporter (DMT)-like permease
MNNYAGELAALGTAVCWAGASNLFATAARTMGSLVLNRLRITAAWGFLTVTLVLVHHALWPTWASGPATLALALSGMIGFIFGDTFQFRSIVILGPGRASLLASTAPLFTTALAWPLLHQRPGPLALLGMLLTVSGTAFVITAPSRRREGHARSSVAMGVASGLLGAIGQAGGYVLSKAALLTGLDPLSGTVIRVGCACVTIWILTGVSRQVVPTLAALRDGRSTVFMLAGALLGPCLGVLLSLTSLHLIEAGVAASITAVSPLFAMLIAARFHNERLTWRSLVGSTIAIAGIVVLFRR